MPSTKNKLGGGAVMPTSRAAMQADHEEAAPAYHTRDRVSLRTAQADETQRNSDAPHQSSWWRWVLDQLILSFAAAAGGLHPELLWRQDDRADHGETEEGQPRRSPPKK